MTGVQTCALPILGASQAASVSPYDIVFDIPTVPDGAPHHETPRGDGQVRHSDDAALPPAPGSTAQGPRRPRRRLAPAPVGARVVAGVIDLFKELFVLPEAKVDDNVELLVGLDGRKMSKSYTERGKNLILPIMLENKQRMINNRRLAEMWLGYALHVVADFLGGEHIEDRKSVV